MRRNEKEIKDQSVIESIIKKSKVMRLALCDGNQPYIIPLNFGYVNSVFYFHSANEGKKLDIIQKNPLVCIEIDAEIGIVPDPDGKACNWGATFESIIASGKAEIVLDKQEKIKGLDLIMKQYSEDQFEYGDNALNGVTLVKIVISLMTGKESKQ